MKTDGTGNIKLIDNVHNLSVQNDWIYYQINDTGNFTLYRIKADGSGETQIVLDSINKSGFYVAENNWIYYNDVTGMDLNNSNNWFHVGHSLSFINATAVSFNNHNDWLYRATTIYVEVGSRDTTTAFYKFNTSGLGNFNIYEDSSDMVKLSDSGASYINIVGDWVYYYVASDGEFYRMRLDGSGRQVVS
jgi:hypothetical protein